jgi:hypothetical protein
MITSSTAHAALSEQHGSVLHHRNIAFKDISSETNIIMTAKTTFFTIV